DPLSLHDALPILTAAIRLNRELIEHLEQGFIPKVHALRRYTRPEKSEAAPPGDKTVHAAAATVLEADNFSVNVYEQLATHCMAICRTVDELTSGGPSQPE